MQGTVAQLGGGRRSVGDTLFELRVRRRRLVGDVVILELTAPDGGVLPPFDAGAHIDLHLGGHLVRQYSLCNDPRERDRYLIGVLREPRSRGGSARVHSDLVEGASVIAGTPRNNFALQEIASRPSLLLGGGIGITPLVSMAWRLHQLNAEFALHYCARARANAAFADDLGASPFAGRVRLHLDDGDVSQRFDASAVLGQWSQGKHAYVCGPSGFIDYVVGQAKALGWEADHIHLERFSAEVETSGGAFKVRAVRSNVEVEVPEGRSIAEVLKAAGVDIPVACEQGVCGTCLTRVIEGVPDHRDIYLTGEERAANNVLLPCCSRSQTPLLVLDL